MNMETNIFGIKTENRFDVNDKFELEMDCGEEIVYLSKETFHHEDETSFDYRYAIDCVNCEGKWFYSLELVILPNSLNKEYAQGVAECCGVDVEDITIYDILSYGGGSVMFGSTSTDCIDEDEEPNKGILDQIATVFETMDSLRGFYLDKSWNMIGTDGWDTINHAVNGTDLFARSLA